MLNAIFKKELLKIMRIIFSSPVCADSLELLLRFTLSSYFP